MSKKLLTLVAILLGTIVLGTPVSFENDTLKVTFDPYYVRYTVVDKRTKQVWEQPLQTMIPPSPTLVVSSVPTIIPFPNDVATATFAIKDNAFVIDVTVKDKDITTVGDKVDWWQRDSVEFWFNSNQYAIYFTDDKQPKIIQNSGNKPLAASSVTASSQAESWSIHAEIASEDVNVITKAGTPFRFALGINDCDKPEENRRAQTYYPTTWVHSSVASFAQLFIADGSGNASAELTDIPVIDRLKVLSNSVEYVWNQPGQQPVTITAELPHGTSSLRFTLVPSDPEATLVNSYPDIAGFIHPSPQAALTLVDGASGHLYPLDHTIFPSSYSLDGDMTFIGITDLKNGRGYGVYGLTPDDAFIAFERTECGNRTIRVPRMKWKPTMGKFGHAPRVYEFTFVSEGGYVALAKIWRQWADKNGYIVTLKEKACHNPNVFKLMGAADLWDGNGLAFATLAKSYCIDKLLLNGTYNPEDMKKVEQLGYLLGRYDVYTDVYNNVDDLEKINAFSAPIPGHIVLNADGSKKIAWVTFDRLRTSWKRCTSLILDTAKKCIPPDNAKHPLNARFLDVTTAESLYECYHPDHPMTRSDKRRHSENVAHYLANWKHGNLNLVTGGEHGKWWCAKDMHYLEGMQSGGHANYSWPAGHRRRPKTKDDDARGKGGKTDRFTQRYEIYGVGPKYRVPLWDLCLHDCITTTWYWGDTNDFLIEAAPEVTPRKDAFNILHASMPTFCINQLGTWKLDRNSFLRSYFHCTKVHEIIGMEEMLSHEFLNEERTIQKTTFTGGYEIIVNMDDKPQHVTLNDVSYFLSPNGFAVDGPDLKQEMILVDNIYYSQVRTPDFYFAATATDAIPHIDGNSSTKAILIVKAINKNHLKVVSLGDNSLTISPDFLKDWDWDTTLVFEVDDHDQRQKRVSFSRNGSSMVLPHAGRFEILCNKEAKRPDYLPIITNVDINAGTVSLDVVNRGLGADTVTVSLYDNTIAPQNLISEKTVGRFFFNRITAEQPLNVILGFTPAEFIGPHKLIVTLDCDSDLLTTNNTIQLSFDFPFQEAHWPVQQTIDVPALPYDSELEPLEMDIDLAPNGDAPISITPSAVCIAEIVPGKTPHILPYATFIPAEGFDGVTNAKGTIVCSYNAKANQPTKLLVLASYRQFRMANSCTITPGNAPGTAHFASSEYIADFTSGTISALAPGRRYNTSATYFLKNLIVSSQATGWATENQAVLKQFDIVLNTPAKCVVVASNTLLNGSTYVKTYTFYPGRFYVDIKLDKNAGGSYSRAFYSIPGIYMDDKGHTVDMAKTKDGANIAGCNPNPQWYAVRGNDWAHSCIALSKFDNVSYWDSTGQIGFTTSKTDGIRLAYFVYGKQPDFDFAKQDYQRAQKAVAIPTGDR